MKLDKSDKQKKIGTGLDYYLPNPHKTWVWMLPTLYITVTKDKVKYKDF